MAVDLKWTALGPRVRAKAVLTNFKNSFYQQIPIVESALSELIPSVFGILK